METLTTELAIKNRKALEKAIKKIGSLSRDIAALQGEMDAATTKVIRPFLEKIETLRARVEALDVDAVAYCEAHRDELLAGAGGKTVRLSTGTVQFKQARARVVIGGDEGDVVTILQSMGLINAIRLTTKVDRQYILKHPEVADRVGGLSIEAGGETIVIKPRTIS